MHAAPSFPDNGQPDGRNSTLDAPISADVTAPGDHVDLRAEIDCVVVMSACPQDIVAINSHAPRDVHFIVEPDR